MRRLCYIYLQEHTLSRRFASLFLLTLLLTISGCIPLLQNPPQNAPRRTPAPAITRPLPPTSTAAPPEPTATPVVALNPSGPWLVYLSASRVGYEMVAANPDGRARTVVAAFTDLSVPVLALPENKGARWFSLLNGRDTTLTVFQLPEGTARRTFNLIENDALSVDQRRLYAAILNQKDPPAQAWSPDGRFLAFIGAMDGVSTDLYVYDAGLDELARLTEGAAEAYFPAWSPDGAVLLLQEVETFSLTGTSVVRRVYAVDAQTGDFTILYNPNSQAEQIYGWLDEVTFVVASRRQPGWMEARRYLLDERKHAQLRYSGPMERAVLDPVSGALAFISVGGGAAGSLPQGLYWASAVNGPVTVARGKWQRLAYSAAAKRFFAASPLGALTFAPGEKRVEFAQEDSLPLASPDGRWLAFISAEGGARPGLRIYAASDGKLLREISGQPVHEAAWRPDSRGLYYISTGALVYLPMPLGEPTTLAAGVSNLGWVGAGVP